MNRISFYELDKILDPIIIDIRNIYYYNVSHIANAINIPYYNLLNNYSHYLNKYDIYYLYCDTGRQSGEIADRLCSFGYHVYSIVGGYLEYQKLK